MTVIDSIVIKWVQTLGGSSTIYEILSLMFLFTLMFIFYKIST